jgi:hypothetical protein
MCGATVVVAVATIVYASVTLGQLSTMKAQLKQMQLSSRAWVGCRGVSCAPIIADQPFGVTLALKNTGQTPANKVKIGFAVHTGERDCDIESVAAGRADRAMIDIPEGRAIPPAIDITMANFATGVDNTCLAKIKDGTLVLYVFGEVVYQDVFRERHMTAYCCVVDPNTWKLNAYKQYNYMY